jgi:hypothetical protein
MTEETSAKFKVNCCLIQNLNSVLQKYKLDLIPTYKLLWKQGLFLRTVAVNVANRGDYVPTELWLLTGPLSSPHMMSDYRAEVE